MNATELKAAFAQLPQFDSVPKEYTWDRHRYELQKHVANDDLTRFLRWPTIQATMFVGDAPYVKQELVDLQNSQFPPRFWDAITESPIGDPRRLPYANWTSGNLVHQATHLRMLMEHTDIHPMTLNTIIEFGGGYGAMALLMNKMGFPGAYLIVDFPELCLLQEFYLSQHLGTQKIESITVDNFGVGFVDLFIACYSLSEAPQDIRDTIFERVRAKYYLLAFQDTWDGVNLPQEFWRITEELDTIDSIIKWTWISNPYLPGHTYLIGEHSAA